MADQAEAAADSAEFGEMRKRAEIMSAFSMFPQEDMVVLQTPEPAPATPSTPLGRAYRPRFVPGNSRAPETALAVDSLHPGDAENWHISATHLTMSPPLPHMAAPAPELVAEQERFDLLPEPELVVHETETTAQEPTPTLELEPAALDFRTLSGRIEPLHIETTPGPPTLDADIQDSPFPLSEHEEAASLFPIGGGLFESLGQPHLSQSAVEQPLLARLIVWQVATAASLALAVTVGLAAFLFSAAPTPMAIAAIGVVNAPAPLYLAEVNSAGSLRLTALATITVPNGRDLQLWTMPPGDSTPTSLGVVSPRGTVVNLPAVPAEGTRFVISMEPQGGVTSGRITGQVLYGGTLANR